MMWKLYIDRLKKSSPCCTVCAAICAGPLGFWQRPTLREVLPHAPTSPNAYDPTDVALGYVGGITRTQTHIGIRRRPRGRAKVRPQ